MQFCPEPFHNLFTRISLFSGLPFRQASQQTFPLTRLLTHRAARTTALLLAGLLLLAAGSACAPDRKPFINELDSLRKLRRKGSFAEARKKAGELGKRISEELAEDDPLQGHWQLELGYIWLETGKAQKAAETFSKARAAYPEELTIARNRTASALALTALLSGKPDSCREWIDTLENNPEPGETDPAISETLLLRAILAYLAGENEKALRLLEQTEIPANEDSRLQAHSRLLKLLIKADEMQSSSVYAALKDIRDLWEQLYPKQHPAWQRFYLVQAWYSSQRGQSQNVLSLAKAGLSITDNSLATSWASGCLQLVKLQSRLKSGEPGKAAGLAETLKDETIPARQMPLFADFFALARAELALKLSRTEKAAAALSEVRPAATGAKVFPPLAAKHRQLALSLSLDRANWERASKLLEKTAPEEQANFRGLLFFNQGKYGKAAAVFKKILAENTNTHPDGHPRTAITLHNLGMASCKNRQLKEGCTWLKKALKMGKKHFPGESLYLAHSQLALGQCLYKRGQFRDAEQELAAAFAIYEKLEIGRFALAAAHYLGHVHINLGSRKKAWTWYARTLKRAESVYGPNNKALRPYLQSLLVTAHMLGKGDEEKTFRKRIQELDQ